MLLMIARAFDLVRVDLTWAAVEVKKGKYNFCEYDALLVLLKQSSVGAYFIFGYGNYLTCAHAQWRDAAYHVWRAFVSDKTLLAIPANRHALGSCGRIALTFVPADIWTGISPPPGPSLHTNSCTQKLL